MALRLHTSQLHGRGMWCHGHNHTDIEEQDKELVRPEGRGERWAGQSGLVNTVKDK